MRTIGHQPTKHMNKKRSFFLVIVIAFVLYLLADRKQNSKFIMYDSNGVPHEISRDSADRAFEKSWKNYGK